MDFNSKRAKENNEDRISALPDVIRSHILCFMPTRDAVKTCVLSHAWKNAWVSVPDLDISVSPSKASTNWSNFVDRLLVFRGLTNNIHKFRLQCTRFQSYSSRIDLWINTAIRCKVVELDLDLSDYGRGPALHFELPKTMFVCKTLCVMKMKLGPNAGAPALTSNSFPSLKYLHVTLDHGRHLGSIEKLFASCPEVEDLIICVNFDSLGDTVLNIAMSAPKLRRLKLCFRADKDDRDKIFIKADVPNLESLDLRANFLAIFSFNAKSLNGVKIELEGRHRNLAVDDFGEFANRLHKFKVLFRH